MAWRALLPEVGDCPGSGVYPRRVGSLERLAELVPDPALPVDEASGQEVVRDGAAFAAAVGEASSPGAAAWGVARCAPTG